MRSEVRFVSDSEFMGERKEDMASMRRRSWVRHSIPAWSSVHILG